MARGSNIERVNRLKAALTKAKRAKAKNPMLSNTELVHLYGVSKGAFTNVKNQISAFPDAEEGPRNTLLYPAVAAIEALIAYETREDEEEAARRKLANDIVGASGNRGRRKKSPEIFLPPSEMMKYSRLQAEIEERERQQGEYIPVQEVRDLAAAIYGVVKEPLQQLELKVDPNGLLTAEQRAKISELGRTALLGIARQIEGALGIDADDHASRSKTPARKAKRASKPRARRKSK